MIHQALIGALAVSLLAIALTESCADSEKAPSEHYKWQNVQMVGGGYVDGIIFHPSVKGLRYARTDMGGAYRWDQSKKRWTPILDWLSEKDTNLMGVESIAVDPSDPKRVYLACGTYTNDATPNGAILRSNDYGHTFERTDMAFKMGGNENGRGGGERLAVDPNDGRILYMGSRQNVLWRSVDRGLTWHKVESFPEIKEEQPANMPSQGGGAPPPWAMFNRGAGIISVLFDNAGSVKGAPTQTIYIAVSVRDQNSLYRSRDAGATWQPVAGQPTPFMPIRMALTPENAKDRYLYITYGSSPGPGNIRDGAVWRLNVNTNEWTNITPDKPDPDNNKAFGYGGISVDRIHPETIIVASAYRPKEAGGENIFRSNDCGKTWKTVLNEGGGKYDYTLAPYIARTGIHWLYDLEIDPFDSNHAIFTTGYGGHETFNLTDLDTGKPTLWSIMSTGIEETVPLDMISPSVGAPLIIAIGDYGGFVQWDLDQPAPEGNFTNPGFGNTTSIAWAEVDTIVRVGRSWGQGNPNIAYSLNGGKTWQPCAAMPPVDTTQPQQFPFGGPPPQGASPARGSNRQSTAALQNRPRFAPVTNSGTVASSIDGAHWIWTPSRNYPFVTHDLGATWTKCLGIEHGLRVIADSVNPHKFYALDLPAGKLYTSVDDGNTFQSKSIYLSGGLPKDSKARFDNRGGQDRIYAAPDREGELWLAAFDGLYRSTDTGDHFSRIPGVTELHGFGFGKAAPGKDFPALYVIGIVKGVYGFFRSVDIGQNWVRINDDQHQYGLALQIIGDPRIYGRSYVAAHGRGVIYGDIVKK